MEKNKCYCGHTNYCDCGPDPEKKYTYQDMLEASKYGYNFHKNTSFPEQEFEDSCVRNTQQWLTIYKNKLWKINGLNLITVVFGT